MTDNEFMNLAEALLLSVEQHCDRINELHEVWLAARSGGYHYRHNGETWMDTKGQGDFWVQLGQDASAQAGLPLSFSS